MGGLSAAIRGAVEAVRLATEGVDGVQADVVHEAWTGQGGRVDPKYATGVVRPALVHLQPHQHQRADGQMVQVRATLAFLQGVEANGAEHREEPIDPRDRLTITLGDKTVTGPVVDVVPGLIDPSTNLPFLLVVYLG